jgi:hypothetical protein
MNHQPAVTIYCASSPDAPQQFLTAAHALGQRCAHAGLATVTGAGCSGLMGAVVDGTLAADGTAIGVIPEFMTRRGWQNPRMTELHVTSDMHSRKALLVELGSGAIALPGGMGTLDELMDLLTLCQLDLYHHPVVILNIDGFYDNLLRQFAHAEECNMMRHFDLRTNLYHVATTPEEAVEIIARHVADSRR